MSRREKAFEIMFLDKGMYVSKSVIQHFLGISAKEATKFFNNAKKIDMNRKGECQSLRPTKVLKKTVFELSGINYKFTLNQYLQEKERLKNESITNY